MIPRANVTAWRSEAPWPDDAQVEQDLVLTRAIIELFSDDFLSARLAFRGGTALYKLFLEDPLRYSEDIDLVQRLPERIGPTLDRIRDRLDPWLGAAEWDQGERGTTLTYRFESEIEPIVPLRLKVEINTREHGSLYGYEERPLSARNPWFSGSARVITFHLDELMGTKMRALYQRRQGRDLFDFWVLLRARRLDCSRVVEAFRHYLERQGQTISRAEYEENLRRKMADGMFLEEVRPLLASGVDYDADEALDLILEHLVVGLPGEPWKGDLGPDRE